MSRHKTRLDRMTLGMGRSAEELENARLDRMTDEELLAEAVGEAVKAGFDPEIARTDPDAAIAWVDAEGDRITALAVVAGFDPELAQTARAAAVRWYEERGGDEGREPAQRGRNDYFAPIPARDGPPGALKAEQAVLLAASSVDCG